jgi:hypothetical protein
MPGQLEQRPARKRLPSTSSRRSCFSGRLFPSLTLGIVVPRICNHLGPGWVVNHGAMLHLKLWLLRNACGSNSLNFRSIKRGKIRNESLGSPTTHTYIMSIYTVTHSYTYIRYCIIYVITCAMLMESNLLRSVTSSAKRHHNWSNWSAISPIHSYTTILWLELMWQRETQRVSSTFCHGNQDLESGEMILWDEPQPLMGADNIHRRDVLWYKIHQNEWLIVVNSG